MATYEYVGAEMTTKDYKGDTHLLYPITKTEAVDGLEESLTSLDTDVKNIQTTTDNIVVDSEVVDNLLSNSTTLPLSANQGRVLNEKLEEINEETAGMKLVVDGTGKIIGYKTDVGGNTVFPIEGSGGSLTLLHSDFVQPATGTVGASSINWNYTATESCKLLVHVVCAYDGNNNSGTANVITATKNGDNLTPVKIMQATYYSKPLTHIYEVEVVKNDILVFTGTSNIIDDTSNPASERTYLVITAYKC